MGDQFSLLPDPDVADEVVASTPGRARRSNPPTSKRAALNVAIKSGALKHRILIELQRAGALGRNDWELHVHCDPKGRVHSAATRRKELADEFNPPLVRTTAITRPTDTPTNEGFVHVLTEAGAAVLAELERRSEAA